jgi:hypothetical protein
MTSGPRSNPEATLLDRRAEARLDPDWARAAARDPDTRYVISRDTTHLVHSDPPAQIALLTADHPTIAALPQSQLLLLGWLDGTRLVLVDLPADEALQPPGTEYQDLRPLLSVAAGQAEVLHWRAR